MNFNPLKFHSAITKLSAEVLYQLADSEILPLNPQSYAIKIKEALQTLMNQYGDQILENNLTIGIRYFRYIHILEM